MKRLCATLAAALIFCVPVMRGGDRRPVTLNAVISTDSTEVHPDDVFEVTLSLENPTDSAESIVIPDPGWDRTWKSSNRNVTWDNWDVDVNEQVTIEVPAHGSYVFPRPLKMFVNKIGRKSRVEFRMGFRTKAFAKMAWSNTISLLVTP